MKRNLIVVVIGMLLMGILLMIFHSNQYRLVRVIGYYNLTMCQNDREVILPVTVVGQYSNRSQLKKQVGDMVEQYKQTYNLCNGTGRIDWYIKKVDQR